jgi:hypothetical protein
MKKNTLIIAIVSCASSIFAQPAAKEDAVNLTFTGVYRKDAKMSIARKAQMIAAIEEYQVPC